MILVVQDLGVIIYIARCEGDLDRFIEFPNPEKTDYGLSIFLDSVDTLIIGGRTYFDFLCRDFIMKYKDKETYIISKNLIGKQKDLHIINKNVIETLSQIKKSEGKDIWLVGGGILTSILLESELVDEITINTFPVILGSGIPLFRDIPKESEWKLITTQQYSNGVLQIQYKKDQ